MRFFEFQTLGDMIAKGQFKDLFSFSDKEDPKKPNKPSTPGAPLDSMLVTDVPGSSREDHIHQGVDLRAVVGTPVKATIDGTVTFVGNSGQRGGLCVVINSGRGRKDTFYHLSKFNVEKGDTVKVGQVIALTGNTGYPTTGPHLHWEVNIGGRNVDPLSGQQWTWASGHGPNSNQAARRKN